jgi:predicted membrane protein
MGVLLSTRTDARVVDVPDGEIRLRSIIGGQSWTAGPGTFRGGTASTVMGGVKLDLRQAEIEGDSVVMNLRVVMGGVQIFVPDDWVVVMDIMPMLGGARNQTRPPASEGAPELIVRGSVMMGGIQIRN